MREYVRLNIQYYKDREAIVIALINSGYAVHVKEDSAGDNRYRPKYYVFIDKEPKEDLNK